jgi:pimeloyl-ACP methyl ester carboxylesterase
MPLLQKIFSNKGAEIEYATIGKGTPVVLLHGFGEDHTIWEHQINFLQEHCKLIIPNLPGTGQSKHTDAARPLSIESMADNIKVLLDQENITTCIILGHSMGGYITLAFAEMYPAYLKGFGLIHSTAFADTADKKKNRQRAIEMIAEYGGYAFLKNTIPNLFGNSFKYTSIEIIDQLIEKSKAFNNNALQDYYRAMIARTDKTNVLANTNVPVLFIAGTEDTAAPIADTTEQSKLSSNIQFHILEGVGHMGMLESPNEVNQLMLNFIHHTI